MSAGLNEAVQSELAKITDPALHQLASALVGSVAANVAGGNASRIIEGGHEYNEGKN